MHKAPYLGRIRLYWCENCNVPLITEYCNLCKKKGIKVNISPPGDPRPAFNYDYILLRKLLGEIVSWDIIEILLRDIILLNPVSYIDKMDEIIFQGKVIGNLRFNPEKSDFEIVLNQNGSIVLFSLAAFLSQNFLESLSHIYHFIIVSKEAGEKISEGYNVLAPGIIKYSEFNHGDPVFIFANNSLVGIGTARMSSKNLRKVSRGVVVKNRAKGLKLSFDLARQIGNEIIKKIERKNFRGTISEEKEGGLYLKEFDPRNLLPPNLQEKFSLVLLANLHGLKSKEKEAMDFINRISRKNLPVTVSFSGGKDSIVTFELVRRALRKDFLVFFVNTGIEYPETVDYTFKVLQKFEGRKPLRRKRINDVIVHLGEKTAIIEVPSQRFWIGFNTIGPPGMDWRWCCKSNKLAPTRQLLDILGIAKTLCFVGIRKYESLRRAEEGRITKNPWTGQLNAHPIYNWNALDTWLYIFWRRLPANPLYGKGLSRIGCWPCPSSNLADFRILKNIHPNLYEKLRESISSIARSQGFSQEDINRILQFGVWRWRKIPRKFLEIRGIKRPLQKILKIHNLDKEYIALDLPKMPRDDWEKFKCFLTSLLKQIEKQNSN